MSESYHLRAEKLQIVVGVELRDDLPRHLDEAFVGIAKELKGKVLRPMQVPQKLPPEIPRLVLHAPNLVAQVALNRVELVLRPPSHVAGSATPSLAYFEALLNSTLRPAMARVDTHEWAGAVLTLLYPTDSAVLSAAEGVKELARKLVNLPRHPDELSSFKLQYGFKAGRFFRHFHIEGYETREWVGEATSLDKTLVFSSALEKARVVESGVQLSLDVNNKPAADRGSTSEELRRIISELTLFQTDVWDFLGVKPS